MSIAKQIRRQAEKKRARAADVARREAAIVRAAEHEAALKRRAENPPTAEQRRAMIRMSGMAMAACLGAALR